MWHKLQKPFFGYHWWYRILTGRKYTYPYISQKGKKIYWKSVLEPEIVDGMRKDIIVECKLLNFIASIRMFLDRYKLC